MAQPQPSRISGGFLNPDRVIRHFDIEKGQTVADFGAGHGYFTIPIARAVGTDGRVYAIDIQQEPLDVIAGKAKADHLLNIHAIRGDLETPGGSTLKDRIIDTVLVSSILFQARHPEDILKEAHRVLREKGMLVMIEWDPDANERLGPSLDLRISKHKAMQLAKDTSFELTREFEAGEYHYGLIFTKI